MEIEAKYGIPDNDLFQRLEVAREMAGFTLTQGVRSRLVDLYLDTAERLMLRSGYACRLRTSDDGVVVTLKSFGRVHDGVHYRDEIEERVAEVDPDPRRWPPGRAQSKALELAGSSPLRPLFRLEQLRQSYQVCRGDRLVGEISLDQVWSSSEPASSPYLELEIELGPDGQVADLKVLETYLADAWGLQPETGSKFERALRAALKDPCPQTGASVVLD